jgi:hypothetical protein
MKITKSKVVWASVLVCAAVGLWILGSKMVAHAQQEPGPGPSPNAGETVYAPKKSAKPNLQQQPENQPSEQPEKVPQQARIW